MNYKMMKISQELKEEIIEAALEYWIDYNYEVAQGRKEGEEWLDEDEDEAEEIEVWGPEYPDPDGPEYDEWIKGQLMMKARIDKIMGEGWVDSRVSN